MKYLVNFLKSLKTTLIDIFEKWLFKLKKGKIKSSSYDSLAPIALQNEDDPYLKALKWAYENRVEKSIKNIAITGPYGSGKSTVLKSFLSQYKAPDLKFLNISLASFGNELKQKPDDTNLPKQKIVDDSILRDIEVSILQQIFFYEEDEKIPDSRFKKIRSRSKIWQTKIAFIISILFISICYIHNNNFIYTIFKDTKFSERVINGFHYSSYLFVSVFSFYILYKSSRYISSLSVEKFKIKNVKFTVGAKENKSILNLHLDEILYFFSVRPYNVVIIEDLDRFQQTEIFIKLREINNLLNNTKKLKGKHILFIYAVRDDMFKNVERTKFFDFILPVIPIINSSNSGEKIREWLTGQKFELSGEFIDNVSYFIDDMRLLINICNEFTIYSSLQDSTLLKEKLFAIITYKNKYPKDFVLLNENCGELYSSLFSKQELLNQLMSEFKQKIEFVKSEINRINENDATTIKDLRKIYLLHIIETLGNFHSFYNKGNLTLDQVVSDEHWELIFSGKIQYNRYIQRHHSLTYELLPTTYSFKNIESKVGSLKSYEERVNDIESKTNGKLKQLHLDLTKIQKEKDNIARFPLHVLLSTYKNIKIKPLEILDKSFVELMIINNYIAEDYYLYTTLFHGESLKRNDYQYIIKVKNNEAPNFEYELKQIKNIIPKISEYLFESEGILNFYLFDYILENFDKYRTQLIRFLTQISNGSETSLLFIKGFRKFTKNEQKFIESLSSHNHNLWIQISSSLDFNDDEKNEIIVSLISYISVNDLKEFVKNSHFKEELESNIDLFKISKNLEHSITLIKECNLKFTLFDPKTCDEKLATAIYDGNQYQINFKNVQMILKHYGNLTHIMDNTENYTSINESEADNLASYINNSLLTYVNSVYLKLPNETTDNENDFKMLVSNIFVKEPLEQELLSKWQGQLLDIRLKGLESSPSYLLRTNNVFPSWSNIFSAIDENLIEEDMVSFINRPSNALKLSKEKLTKENLLQNNDNLDFIFSLQDLNEGTVDLIIKSFVNFNFSENIESIDPKWIKPILRNNLLPISIETFHKLQVRNDQSHVDFYIKNTKTLDGYTNELTFKLADIAKMIKSNTVPNEAINRFLIDMTDYTEITNSSNTASTIASFMIDSFPLKTNKDLAFNILEKTQIGQEIKISLFEKIVNPSDSFNLEEFLINLGQPYDKIVESSSRVNLPISKDANKLITKLKVLNYISTFSEKKPILGEPYYRVNFKKK